MERNLNQILNPILAEANNYTDAFHGLLNDISAHDIKSWLNDRISQALIYFIDSQVYTELASHLAGVDTLESVGGTAQKNAEYIGKLDAYNSVLQVIAGLKERDKEEE